MRSANRPGFTDPIFAYHHNHGDPTGCAIAGGTFYDAPAGAASPFPAEYAGDYFFADACDGWVWRLDRESHAASPFASGINPAFGLSTAPDGYEPFPDPGPRELTTFDGEDALVTTLLLRGEAAPDAGAGDAALGLHPRESGTAMSHPAGRVAPPPRRHGAFAVSGSKARREEEPW